MRWLPHIDDNNLQFLTYSGSRFHAIDLCRWNFLCGSTLFDVEMFTIYWLVKWLRNWIVILINKIGIIFFLSTIARSHAHAYVFVAWRQTILNLFSMIGRRPQLTIEIWACARRYNVPAPARIVFVVFIVIIFRFRSSHNRMLSEQNRLKDKLNEWFDAFTLFAIARNVTSISVRSSSLRGQSRINCNRKNRMCETTMEIMSSSR